MIVFSVKVRFFGKLSPVNSVVPSLISSEILVLVASLTLSHTQTDNGARAKLIRVAREPSFIGLRPASGTRSL